MRKFRFISVRQRESAVRGAIICLESGYAAGAKVSTWKEKKD